MLSATVIKAILAFAPVLALGSPVSAASSAEVEVRDDNSAAVEVGDDKSAARSFQESCRSCQIISGSLLSCECKNTIGQWVLSDIELNNYFANDGFWLQWARECVSTAPNGPLS
ncbi:uncharacterized protein LY79DRAFT_691053 [Colletotrichum navitas]|uniref:Cyanovirin-N domain-containing protein n=1 Tax=Colletotrichum navitas TaxID=681940 RepID=A0AAD8PUS3_9PEZI|nr:uncharacterized protein LY79DRAFT_691053 [Colletotrichum navitas]KAK1584996.1 hypothetical protein LY79DRAFT_691053 [Colletotrichum navitas]